MESQEIEYEASESQHLNRLSIEMNDRLIYTCDIRFLRFNLPFDDDIAGKRIIETIEFHKESFSQEANMPKFPDVSEGMRMRNPDLDGSFLDDTSLSLSSVNAPCNSLPDYPITDEEEGEDRWSMDIIDALRNWEKDTFQSPYSYNYGCIMQESESSDDVEAIEEDTKESSTTQPSTASSCACLSLDPPSVYSVCFDPKTPLNTEVSQKESVQVDDNVDEPHVGIKDMNADAEATFSLAEWREVLESYVPTGSDDGTDDDSLDDVDRILAGEGADIDHIGGDSICRYPRQSSPSKKVLIGSIASGTSIIGDEVEDEFEEDVQSMYNRSESSSCLDRLRVKIHELGKKKAKEKYEPTIVSSQLCKSYSGGKCVKNVVPAVIEPKTVNK